MRAKIKVGGFEDAAIWLITKAAKAFNEEARRRMLEEAQFRRQLARITPRFPELYRSPRPTRNRLLDKAEECRAIARVMRNVDCIRQMIDLAKTYEAIAADQMKREAEINQPLSNCRIA